MILPVVIERNATDITEADIIYLSKHGKLPNSKLTEAEVMANIVRDPILIGVTRY